MVVGEGSRCASTRRAFPQILYAFCITACASLLCAGSVLADPLVMDAFAYSDDAAAQSAWVPGASSPQVQMADAGAWGDERVMQLPCDFSVQSSRCYWDRSVPLDLSMYRGLALDVFVPDVAPFGHFTLYFHAGDGWYGDSCTFAEPGWQTFYFSMVDFWEEGTPDGWDQIDGIRLSPWKGADQDTYLAVGELRAFTPPIYIIEDTQSDDAGTVESTIERLSAWLGASNISFGVMTDSLVEQGDLAGSRLAILPYNEVVSSEQVAQLQTFVASGGALMVSYLLPDGVDDLLGFVRTGWTAGDFAAFSFSDTIIDALPDRVRQDSWNITVAAPGSSLHARVIATWEDGEGVSTGHPAWLASDNGLFMSHILLSDDASAKQYMLLALIGHYVPEVWPGAVDAAILAIGRIADYIAYEQAVADIGLRAGDTPRVGEVAASLAAADALRLEAIAARDRGDFAEAVRLAGAARTHMQQAYYLCQSPVEPEFRAVWEHAGTGPFPGDWAAAIDVLADNGFNAVVPNMLWGGLAHYDSAYLPHSAKFDTYGDQISACVSAAHARGVAVHVWKVNWNLSGAPQSYIDSMRAAARTQVSVDGTPIDWLCPSHPDNFALERDSMLEVVANYDVDGVHFDYIRYPNSHHCYCDGCRTRFESEEGVTVGVWPDDVRPGGGLESAFLNWRRAQITELVAAVYAGAKAIRSDIQVSAAVFGEYEYCYDGVGQDWVDWIDQGIVDFLCPMDYTSDFARFGGLVAEQTAYAAGRIPIYPGIGAGASSSTLGPDGVIVEINTTRSAGTGGFIIFNYDQGLAAEHLPALGAGITCPVTSSMPTMSVAALVALGTMLLGGGAVVLLRARARG